MYSLLIFFLLTLSSNFCICPFFPLPFLLSLCVYSSTSSSPTHVSSRSGLRLSSIASTWSVTRQIPTPTSTSRKRLYMFWQEGDVAHLEGKKMEMEGGRRGFWRKRGVSVRGIPPLCIVSRWGFIFVFCKDSCCLCIFAFTFGTKKGNKVHVQNNNKKKHISRSHQRRDSLLSHI